MKSALTGEESDEIGDTYSSATKYSSRMMTLPLIPGVQIAIEKRLIPISKTEVKIAIPQGLIGQGKAISICYSGWGVTDMRVHSFFLPESILSIYPKG